MAVAAAVGGHPEEARFWHALAPTLDALAALRPPSSSRRASKDLHPGPSDPAHITGSSDPDRGRSHELDGGEPWPLGMGGGERGEGISGELWGEAAELAEAQERTQFHETMSRRVIEDSEALEVPSLKLPAGPLCPVLFPIKYLWSPVNTTDMFKTMQERRMCEYVTLGDFQTAVGFLLASTPDRSARYYRDALCTLALAVPAFSAMLTNSCSGLCI